MNRRGRVYAKKNIAENAENEAIQRSAARFIKMNRRGRVYAKKNIAENAENGSDSAFRRRAFY